MIRKILQGALILSVFLMSVIIVPNVVSEWVYKPIFDNVVTVNNVSSEVLPINTSPLPKIEQVKVDPILVDSSYPVRLIIGNAKVNAKIDEVGITPSGNLDVPPNFTDVGWYKFGPKPGQQGSVVLDGHVDNGASIDGVFKHLRDVKEGDDIYITMSDDKVFHYKVQKIGVYPTNNFPGDMVFHENDQKYLKIITCHGTYVPSIKTYDQRLIVTAVLVSNS